MGRQPTCPFCSSREISVALRFREAEALLPVVNGMLVWDEDQWDMLSSAEKFLKCRRCGYEWESTELAELA